MLMINANLVVLFLLGKLFQRRCRLLKAILVQKDGPVVRRFSSPKDSSYLSQILIHVE
jgi:hypothetical protein